MRIATVLGSPRKRGNTATVLEWVEEELRSRGHEVDRINITEHDVRGCLGCYACQSTSEEPGCVQDDGAEALLQRMIAADAIVLASPLYCWEFSAQIKPLIDRGICLTTGYAGPDHRSLVEGRRAGLLVTCAGPIEGNADLIVEAFRRVCGLVKLEDAAQLIVPHCSTPDSLRKHVRDQAAEFARKLAG